MQLKVKNCPKTFRPKSSFIKSIPEDSASGRIDEQQRVGELLVQRDNVFEFSRQICKPDPRNGVLTSAVEEVVQGHPRALGVGGFHGVHDDGIRRHDVDRVLKAETER
jgi:hypothetical protein